MSGGYSLFLIFNHRLTPLQEEDARASLRAERIVDLPRELKCLWSQIPSDLPSLDTYLSPVKRWLESQAHKGDYVLVQGDFGACYIMVSLALSLGLIPVYSTTVREAVEKPGEDGSVRLTHRFRHRAFRRFGI